MINFSKNIQNTSAKSMNLRIVNKGFTLVETLVAIAIFATSVLVFMTVLASDISNTGYAKEKIVASYLAQEGIESVRNLRDTYMLFSVTADSGWGSFRTKLTSASCQLSNGCYLNLDNLFSQSPPMPMTKISYTACSSSCPQFLYDTSSGKYNYTSGTSSGYIRKIRIVSIDANEIKILSTVYWQQGSGTHSLTLSESLENWIE